MIMPSTIGALYHLSRKLCERGGDLDEQGKDKESSRYYKASSTIEEAISVLEDLEPHGDSYRLT